MLYIIVLGGPLTSNLQPGIWLLSRLDSAIKYYQSIKNNISDIKFILTGGYTHNKKISEANVMKKYLMDNKIPEEIIIEENKAINTIENAIYSKNIITQCASEKKDNQNINILVITSDFHIPRSKIIFSNTFGKYYDIAYVGSNTQCDKEELKKINDKEIYLINKLKKYYKIY